ncbi:glycoside hydrolase family 27 protein [Flavobacterium sp. SUN052]|uniref:glycoside hydrolase family 27 protein n=1 Tax=Flavobacterium sp. SUN052 TaxID=3002441 RepID=UPI00237EA386|nr:glycoside hydrolase family 27 protein [Flavobacterium sp. SUN052]MEC4005469.1 glycoside hydrolase family 27 protein [Flavobacterium sp. SUN052]
MKKYTYLLFLLFSIASFSQKFEGLAPTPPMGWNSWNTFETNIDEKLIKETADILVSSGMKEVGYNYIVLDDGWMAKERDVNGNLVPDPIKFPSGLKNLIDYVHSKGLKFGLYNCAGTKTCGGYPGTRGFEYQDARFYASLNIDYLKYDWCNTEGINAKEAYTTMSIALKTAGKPIIFSMCEWGDNQPWNFGKPIANLWRISGDIYPCYDCEFSHGSWSSWGFFKIAEMRKDIRQFSGPDHWNDFDMLEVGDGMTLEEDKSHFALWCLLASPLIAGNDLRKMTPQTLKTLTNKELIAINQDALGIQGFKYSEENGIAIWVKPLENGDWAISFFNKSSTEKEINFNWKQNTIVDEINNLSTSFDKLNYSVRDIWNAKNLKNTKDIFNAKLKSHDVITLRLNKP